MIKCRFGKLQSQTPTTTKNPAGLFAVPLGIILAGRAEITLAFTGSALLFLGLFIFLTKIIRKGMGLRLRL